MKEHIRHIQIVFSRLRQHQLKLKLSKCNFLQKETQYLGFIMSESGIMADPDKVYVIRNMVPPKCKRGKKLHWHVQLLYKIYSKIFSWSKTFN